MFSTHDDLTTAELQLLESQRKVVAQIKIIDELRRRDQSTRIAEKFLSRLQDALTLHRGERDAISARLFTENRLTA